MENPTEKKIKLFKGAGYLIGFFIGSLIAVIFVAISGVEALIGPIVCSVSVPTGMVLENKFQGKAPEKNLKVEIITIAFLMLGFAFLAVTIFFSI